MDYSSTNIFCIIANAGSDQELYLKSILSDKYFMRLTKLSRLLYNTTKPKDNIEDKKLNKYTYSTEEYFKSLTEDDILESRSYYTITYHTVYYFTLKKNIENAKSNLICIASPYQYENYKRWISVENMKQPNRYQLHAILIHCQLKDRFNNKLSRLYSDEDIELLEFCRRILQDDAEFKDTQDRIPELNDPMNCDNVCYINSDKLIENDFNANLSQIKAFILDKIESNQFSY